MCCGRDLCLVSLDSVVTLMSLMHALACVFLLCSLGFLVCYIVGSPVDLFALFCTGGSVGVVFGLLGLLCLVSGCLLWFGVFKI